MINIDTKIKVRKEELAKRIEDSKRKQEQMNDDYNREREELEKELELLNPQDDSVELD